MELILRAAERWVLRGVGLLGLPLPEVLDRKSVV